MGKALQLQDEINIIMVKFRDNRFLMAEAFLQIIHRENIITGNRVRVRHGEEPVVPEPVMYKPGKGKPKPRVEWVIDVPKEWISETGRGTYHS